MKNRGSSIEEKVKSLLSNVSYFVFWVVITGLSVLTAFQLHATLIAASISVIENPNLGPVYWTMNTVHGLGRVYWLVLGIIGLGFIVFSETHLREGKKRGRLLFRFLILLVILGAIYGLSYLILLLLS